ncbi:MAG: hypothetical protein IKU46_01305 [Peptococcaceae bacterium]|nr:hypothetical protein [Peptococcaceae bacterium]
MATKKTRRFYRKDHIVKILLLVIVVWLVFTLASNQIRSAMVQTEEVKSTVLEQVETGYGLLRGSESLVIAQADGTVEPVVQEGERVRKGNAVFKVGEAYSYTNFAGRVSYQLDGLESTSDLNTICSTNLESSYAEQQNGQKKTIADAAAGEGRAKVINTFDDVYLYVTVARSTYTAGLEANQKIPVRLADINEQMQATVTEVLDTADGFRYLKLKLGSVKETVFQQRIYKIEFPYDQQKAVAVSPDVLVEKDGQTGVYYLQKGFVFWEAVTVGQTWEKNGKVIIESGLEDGDMIVTTPHLVREGENIKF